MRNVINWQRICDSNSIEYVDRGPNVKRGEINIKCPFCGAADPSHHLGLNQNNGWWACWRNETHRGKSPLRLLIKLLGISFQKAKEIAGYDKDYVDPEGFTSVLSKLTATSIEESPEGEIAKTLSLSEYKPIRPSGSTSRFYSYLLDRGFSDKDVSHLGNSEYSLRASINGTYKDRIVIPYILEGNVVSWTARAIAESVIRYKDLPLEECIFPPKHVLYNVDAAFQDGKILVLVEGAFDALKIDLNGKKLGVRAVALSTKSITEHQIFMLEEVAFNFERVVVMLDIDKGSISIIQSMKMKNKLSQIKNIEFDSVPFGVKDAGELSKRQAMDYCRSLINE